MKQSLPNNQKEREGVLHVLQGKKYAAVIIGVMILLMIALSVLGLCFFNNMNLSIPMPVCVQGEYSLDGGEWKTIEPETEINRFFHKAVFKGRFPDEALWMNNITISSKNVWYTLKKADGTVIAEHKYNDGREIYQSYLEEKKYEALGEKKLSFEEFKEKHLSGVYFQMNMPNTPGYCVNEFYLNPPEKKMISEKTEIILEVICPYDKPRAEFSDCFNCLISGSNGKYMQFFYSMPVFILFLLVCFFGIFFFPLAGLILGKIDYSYLSFGVLCFTWGLFMLIDNLSGFMNLWILDTTVCLALDILPNYFFILSMHFYLKSNFKRKIPRLIGNMLGTGYLIMIILAATLHFTSVIDLHAISIYTFPYIALCAVTMAVLLCVETKFDLNSYDVLLSCVPLATTLILDAVNHYVHFTTIDFFYYGLAVTIIYQMIRSIMRLKRQYAEAIRYQQMQKELYEAKVSVMVSQIQPHFMYNALSSIAMLCKLDADTAYQATITFSQYLRSNMDSLKQTKPIPFKQELEHLKKYLYIEKLRFGKKLNIEYDIQVTDFMLPQLSIQPLAENAVKHGISKKRGGGTLTIATHETDDAYEVIVSDDGTGFDINEVKDDGRSHVGMENIRRRLKEMCNAEVLITSVIGEGTVAKVIIPKEEPENENNVR